MTSQITEHEQHETEQNLSYVESLWDEAQSSFEMLDKKQEGVLNLHDARHWLRCLGWCDSDKELDDILLRGLENGYLLESGRHFASWVRKWVLTWSQGPRSF